MFIIYSKNIKRFRQNEKSGVFKHKGKLTLGEIKKIAQNLRPKSLSKEIKGVAVGIMLMENRHKDDQKDGDAGK